MLRLAIRFPGGAYHATPWGRHVNEGDIEWPPSPWRLCRALLATGFGKLGWVAPPPEARRLVERLAAAPPVVHLPLASTGHTRHYVPIQRGATAKVIDAFAFMGRGEEAVLGVTWDVELPAAERDLMELLAERLSYLGRAESWVTAEVVEELPAGLSECRSAEAAPGPRFERIALLAPLGAEEYATWRRGQVEGAGGGGSAGKTRSTAAEKREAAKLDALYPADLFAALLKETGDLQRDGWSQPPGSRWLSYWRESEILSAAPRGVPAAPRRPRPMADTALLALSSDTVNRNSEVLPLLEDALPRMEVLHAALVKRSDREGLGPSPCLSGKDADNRPLQGHEHAWLVPLCLGRGVSGEGTPGGVGRLDHVLVHAKMGFDAAARSALERLRALYLRRENLPDIFVTLVGVGQRGDFESRVPSVRESKVWRSVMPFVAPRHLKPRGAGSLEGQVQAELASRGLPAAERIEVELEGGVYLPAAEMWPVWERRIPAGVVMLAGGESGLAEGSTSEAPRLASRWRLFRRERVMKRGQKPPVAMGLGLRLTFAKPLRGPIALGYASHFGLGSMTPGREE